MLKNLWTRLFHYEFWPYWFFYFPAYFYYFFLVIRSKRWIYFSVLNPCMNFGGAFLSSKIKSLQKIPKSWLPKSIHFNAHNTSEVLQQIQNQDINFPCIIKPDLGERVKRVEIINNSDELESYFIKYPNDPFIVQEYINYPIELGILFYWDLEGNPKISSIGKKKFCTLTGNGKDTLQKLVEKNHRIYKRKKIIKAKFSPLWNQILPLHHTILIEPIGNHNRGTIFLDARHHYSSDMLQWITECAKTIPGFDFGRFDIKIENWDAFKNKKGIKVLEINGVNSEPIHIYDPHYNIWKAYRDIFHQMHTIYKLSKNKLKEKQKTVSLLEFIRGS